MVEVTDNLKHLTLFNLLEDAVIAADMNDKVVFYNKAAEDFFCASIDDAMGRPIEQLAPFKESSVSMDDIKAAVRSEGLWKSEATHVSVDGKKNSIHWTVKPLELAETGVCGMISFIRIGEVGISDEQALRQEKAFTDTILDALMDTVFVLDPNTSKAVRWNKAFREISGFTDEEIAGRKAPDDWYSEQDLKRAEAATENIIEGKPGSVEMSLITKEGDPIPTEYQASMIYDEEGKPQFLIAIGRDVSERKQAEKALRDSEDKYRNLVERATDGIIIVQDRLVKFANTRLAEIFGYTVSEIMGTPFIDLVSPDERSRIMDIHQRRMQGKDAPNTYEIQGLRKDGKKVFIENNSGITTFNGKQATLAFVRDVTERKQTERALRESEDKIRSIIDTSKDWIWEIDLKGLHIYSNPAVEAILGYRPEEVIGNPSLGLMHEDDRRLVEAKLPEWIEKKCGWQNLLIRWKHKQGGWRNLESNAVPILDADGYLAGFRGVDRDITDRIHAEMELRDSEERYRRLTDNAKDLIYRMSLPDGRYEYMSPASVGMFGYAPEEFIDSPALIQKVIHPDWRDYFEREWAKLIKGDMPPEYEYQIVHKSGETRWLNQRNVLVQDDSGSSIAIEGIVTDVTERKRAEQALRDSESRLREAQKMANLGNWFWDVKTGDVQWSEEIFKIFRLDPKEFTPQIESIQALSPWPEEHERDKELIQRAIESREQGSYEQRFLFPDGTTGYYFSTFQGIYDSDGELKAIKGTVQDITDRKRAEEALHESEQGYRTLAEASFEGIVITERGKILVANRRFAEILGYEHDEVIGRRAVEFVYPEDLELVAQNIQMGNEGPYQHRSVRKDGTIIHLEIHARTTIYEGRQVRITAITDVTEREQASEKLKKWAHIFEHAEWGVVVSSQDGKKQELMNPAYAKMHGYTVEELSGKPVSDVFTPKGRKELPDIIRKVNEKGHYSFEADHVRKDGSVFPALIDATAVKDEKGDFLYRVVNVQDITDRKQAEEALRESEEKHRALIENLSDMILILDKDGVNRWNSPAVRQYGMEPEDAIGINARDYTHPDDRDRVDKVLNYIVEHPGEIATLDGLKVVPKDGRTVYLDDTFVYLPDAPGINGIVVTCRNVTERNLAEQEKAKLEDQLRQAQKMEGIGRLAGGVAHDFNNLLTGINGYAEMIMDGLKPGDPMRADMEEILSAGERAAGLTAQLLAFARKQIISPRMISPNEILENSQKMLRRIIGEDVDFAFMPGKELGSIKADPHQLDQILVNLAVNARDAMPHGGKLTIETQNVDLDEEFCKSHAEAEAGAYVMLAVSDTGHGMDAETKSKIFEPFFSTKSKDQGTGLGLATVYGIVKQNNGFIYVYSEPDVITTFKVYFPRAAEEADIPVKMKAPDLPTGTETVLLVEDEAVVRRLAKKVLENQGYKVIEASDGGEAYIACKKHSDRIDILLTDVIMPTMNGRELHDKLLAIKPDLKALFMSGYTENVIAHHGVLDEDTHFIQKPFNVAFLAQKVREVLDG